LFDYPTCHIYGTVIQGQGSDQVLLNHSVSSFFLFCSINSRFCPFHVLPPPQTVLPLQLRPSLPFPSLPPVSVVFLYFRYIFAHFPAGILSTRPVHLIRHCINTPSVFSFSPTLFLWPTVCIRLLIVQ